MLTGLLLVLVAGIFQGTFVFPLTMTKKWHWENGWFTFSLLGMLLLNWLLAAIFIPDIIGIVASCPPSVLTVTMLFGFCWGCGSVLFGIGMQRLGLSLGYPIIMGLIASMGALIPLALLSPAGFLSLKGVLLIVSAIIVWTGITVCAKANSLKQKETTDEKKQKNSGALMIAVAAGILSCLPNVGASFGVPLTEAAKAAGASDLMAGNAVWTVFFTVGFIPNAAYTIYLATKNKSFGLFRNHTASNAGWCLLMSILWIGSFYIYGAGASGMGNWGLIFGWPLFIAISIITGNLCGYLKGEWKTADAKARKLLNAGMWIIFAAIVVLAICNFF